MSDNENVIPHVLEHAEKALVYTVVNGSENEKSVSYVGDETYLKVMIPRRSAVIQLYASFYNENGYIRTFCASYLETDNGMDVYTVYPGECIANRDVYFIKFDCNTSYGKKFLSFCGNEAYLSYDEGTKFQLLVAEKRHETPSWFGDGIIYHIFVDRFNKTPIAHKRKDAVYYSDWERVPEYPEYVGAFLKNNTFFGGTLWGVIEKLDYIKSLGTKTIYLSPIFKSYSNHKYDTGDYLQVDEDFGGDEALKQLLDECKKRELNVILDGVFNHVGDDSIYFNRFGKYDSVGACQSTSSEFYPWFNFYDYPEDYDSWWGIKNLPKVNKIPSFRKFICNKVIPKYMKMGISGWRLDVADELEGSFLKQITDSARSQKGDSVIVGEVWEDASCKSAYGELKHYFDDNRLDSVMNYPLRRGIISFLKSKDATELKKVLRILNSHYPCENHNLLMNVLGTHDTERILTVLGGEPSTGLSNKELANKKMSAEKRSNALKLLADGYLLLSAMPGVPCIYYGDEAGTEGYHDPFNRRTFPWGKEDKKTVERFSAVGKLRNSKKAFKTGCFKLFESDEKILAFERYTSEESIIVIANYSDEDIYIPINNVYCDLLNNQNYTDSLLIKNNTVILAEQRNYV